MIQNRVLILQTGYEAVVMTNLHDGTVIFDRHVADNTIRGLSFDFVIVDEVLYEEHSSLRSGQ